MRPGLLSLVVPVGLAACAGPDLGAPREAHDPAARRWVYDVTVGDGARVLEVVADFPARTRGPFEVDARTAHALSEVREVGGAPLVRDGPTFHLSRRAPSEERPLRLSWRVDLEDAARDSGRAVRRTEAGGDVAWSLSVGTFLLRPRSGWRGTRAEVRYHPAGDERVASGLPPMRSGEAYHVPAARLDRAATTVLGRFERRRFSVGETSVELAVLPGARRATTDVLEEYVSRNVRALARFLGRFPTSHLLVEVLPSRRSGYGRAVGSGGLSVLYLLDARAGREQVLSDWVLTHELLHAACPLLAREHRWFEEGLATYLEPIVRAREGWVEPAEVWAEFARDMPNGQPATGDRGLDRTRTWGRTYWGGALFCLVADVALRERTGGEVGLREALAAVVAEGGSIAWPSTLRATLEAADRGTGQEVLVPLWEAWRHAPVSVDLESLWSRLGVRPTSAGVELDDGAPLAHVRRAITARAKP